MGVVRNCKVKEWREENRQEREEVVRDGSGAGLSVK